MELANATSLLEAQRTAAGSLQSKGPYDPVFVGWRRDTIVVIQKIFGLESRHQAEFAHIQFVSYAYDDNPMGFFNQELETAREIIGSMIRELNSFGLPRLAAQNNIQPMKLIEDICLNFHRFVRQLQARHEGRATMEINDEYDVQYLMHAILKLHFDDIRVEEYVPSYAGGASRMDFLLKKEEIVVEVKKTRNSLRSKELGEQLIIDRARYEAHPQCKTLVCFVYDPEAKIGNPAGIQSDLESSSSSISMRVIISPI